MIRRWYPTVIRTWLAVVAFVAGGCNKFGDLGIKIIPTTDDVGAVLVDTLTLISHTVPADSVLTSSTINNLCGTLYDPVFGETYAAFYTEFQLPTSNVDFGSPDTLFIDSVVLTLAYAGFYGYKNTPQTFRVYEIMEPLSPKPATGYYSSRAFAIRQDPIGEKKLFIPNFTDSVPVLNGKAPPHLRIRLSERFGQNLLQQSGRPAFSNDSTFKQFFRGICVAPDTVEQVFGGCVLSFNLESLLSGLRIYWHTPSVDSLSFTFPITAKEVRTNYFLHTYGQSPVGAHVTKDPTRNDSVIFVQAGGGVKTRILIPYLKNLGPLVVNKAELVITSLIDPARTDSIFTPPDQLLVLTLDTAGKEAALPDANSLLTFGGAAVRKVTLQRRPYVQYRFSLARQIQDLIDGKTEDRGLFLVPFRRGETVHRLVAGGANRNDAAQMKLVLIYTPIK